MVLDYFDQDLVNLLSQGGLSNYQSTDKGLDLYYLSLECWVAVHWQKFIKRVAVSLYLYRLLGVIIFGITTNEFFLFLFPNLFENFFLLYSGLIFILKKEPVISKRRLGVILLIISLPKLYQEVFLHVIKIPIWPGSFN